jgi:uncharacterized protein YndB with AHSA1/START domain
MQDTIKRQMIFNSSRQKVWDAITKVEFICQWFSTDIDMPKLEVGEELTFRWSPPHGYSRAIIEIVEPITHFAYRWENQGVDQSLPVSEVPKTLVSFVLDDVNEGTRLTLTESGFEALANAGVVFQENSSGWDSELKELQDFIEAA